MTDDTPLTWGDFQAIFGAVILALMRPLTEEQRRKIAADISAQSLSAEQQDDQRSAEMLRRLAEIPLLANDWLLKNQ